ncbi:hypothetical protein ISCGN_012894 [Ixodes scapularis]
MNAVTWEELKEDVKLKAFRHSQEKAARERAEKRRLMKTLEILIAEENRSPGLFSQDIRDCKGYILELLEKEYRGAMVRSRTLFLERDEEPSKIFKTKERQHASRNKIGKLQVGDVEVTRQEEIEDAFLQAYTDLFTRVEDDGVLQTTGVALPKISPKAVTVLIQKKNSKGTPKVDHFRPISLLTSDYKILAKILAKRLEWGLRDVVGEHQAYGIKRRTIGTNLHAMRIVCEAAQVLKLPVAVLQVDLSKAFDPVRHSFLFRLMEECGIGVRLLRYVQLCYRDITTRLLVNGNRTAPIGVTRSVRQGCPMSPILFALYLEPLCRAIIGDASIRGLSLASGTLKVLAYADDVTVLCSSRMQVRAVTQHIADFCSVSGAAMNTDKSVGAWLGDWDLKPEQFLGVTWTTSVSNYLGLSLTAEKLSGRCGGLDINRLRSKVTIHLARQHPYSDPYSARALEPASAALHCLYPWRAHVKESPYRKVNDCRWITDAARCSE